MDSDTINEYDYKYINIERAYTFHSCAFSLSKFIYFSVAEGKFPQPIFWWVNETGGSLSQNQMQEIITSLMFSVDIWRQH